MDQMIHQIVEAGKRTKTFSEAELQQVADYLMGKTPFEKVRKLLPTAAGNWYSGIYSDNEEIARACAAEPKLLPRLGRHLVVMRHMNGHLYHRLVEYLLRNDLTPGQIFLDSELDPGYALEYMFWQDEAEPWTLELLDRIYDTDPDALERYLQEAKPLDRLRPLAYYCARKDWGRASLKKLLGKEKTFATHLAQDLMLGARVVALRAGGGAVTERLVEAVGELLPELASMADDKDLRSAAKSVAEGKRGNVSNRFFDAMHLAGYRLDLLVCMLQAAYRADSQGCVEGILLAWRRCGGAEKIDLTGTDRYYSNRKQTGSDLQEGLAAQVRAVEVLLEQIPLDAAGLCAWVSDRVSVAPESWQGVFEAVYGENKAMLQRALEFARPLQQIYIHLRLEQLGEPLPLERCEALAQDLLRASARSHSQEGDVEQVIDWLSGGEDLPADKLPGLGSYFQHGSGSLRYRMVSPMFRFDMAMCLLAGASPMAGRYLQYLAVHGHAVNLCGLVVCLGEQRDWAPEQIADYIVQNEAQLGAVRAITGQIDPDGGEPVLRAVVNRLVGDDPALAAGLLGEKDLGVDQRLVLLSVLYQAAPDYDPDLLISLLGDKSKKVRQHARSFLLPKKELADKVRPLLEAKKKDVREAAEALLQAWEGEGVSEGDADLVGYCSRNLPGNAMAGLRWAIGSDLPTVRWRENGAKADDLVVQCYLSLILTQKSIDLPPAVPRIREALNEQDLRDAARQVYDSWLADGAPAKYKAAVLFLGLHATPADVLDLQRQIDDWSQHSRGAIAAEAVRAMALGGSDLALMTVDSIGRKFKNKQVRRAGQEAFAAAAAALGTTPEALGDRIIPTLGFDARGERVIDYGTRQFTAILSPSLSIELQDGTGKTIKSLPKPGAKDDLEKAEREKADFTALKKSLKAVVGTQSARLEQALATGRRWSHEGWEKLFVQNPIMHSFAIGLIWGAYDGDALLESFRYMEDGSFTNVDEDDVDLKDYAGKEIGLVHPLDLGEAQIAAWREQLSDYDITQPIPQMERPVFHLEGEEAEALVLERFAGKKMLGITLLGKLQKLGWYKGSVTDGGGFFTFYKEVGEVGMQLYFSGMYISPDPDEVITVGQAGFYRAGSVRRGSYVYDDVNKQEIIPLAKVPPRMLSELIHELGLATASSTEQDENWRRNTSLQFFDGK